MMRAWLAGLALLTLTACAGLQRDVISEQRAGAYAEPVTEEVVVVEEPEVVFAEPSVIADCVPGDDDGIGGTGCRVE